MKNKLVDFQNYILIFFQTVYFTQVDIHIYIIFSLIYSKYIFKLEFISNNDSPLPFYKFKTTIYFIFFYAF